MSNIEKIRQEIERRIKLYSITNEKEQWIVNTYWSVLAFIDSLPEEKATCKTCGFYENNCPFIRGKLIPYPNKVCKDYTYSVMKEQKPSEDLKEAAIDFADNARKQLYSKDYAISSIADYDHGCIDGFIAGAEWQRIRDAARRK